ncbi:hypothetical protein B0H66DRAFT_613716 [Apodospora peruviana]|uniref:Helitron helicase-like domain-containing protein n=1 Tax=Apodospora peruviana TaxID=516989 RepID=A0AAE0IU84_9PEZI|nr:hypothetical protein B0H66DRAFT_613716 [Apodospora peruviana]
MTTDDSCAARPFRVINQPWITQIVRVSVSGLPFLAGLSPPFSAGSDTLGKYMPSGPDVSVRPSLGTECCGVDGSVEAITRCHGWEAAICKPGRPYSDPRVNDRGSLHLHGLLWLEGNMELPSLVDDMANRDEEEYRAQVVRYLDSVFHESLDEEAGKAVRKERVWIIISGLLVGLKRLGRSSRRPDSRRTACPRSDGTTRS